MGVNGKLVSQDVDSILYKILNASSKLKAMISGDIYKEGFRPTNSRKEDIIIGTIALSQEQPQIAISNINAYVPDLERIMNSAKEYIPNTVKLKSLAEAVKEVIDEALVSPLYKDFSVRVENQKTFKNQDSENREHFQNLRIELIIPNT